MIIIMIEQYHKITTASRAATAATREFETINTHIKGADENSSNHRESRTTCGWHTCAFSGKSTFLAPLGDG